VATAVGGTVEAVEEGVTGFVVPPRDPVLMAERILRLLDDPALHSRMAAASRDRFERLFRVERMARDHESLYRDVLGAAA
jgi:glycosyltransferase involved in cell wall biosynthesis